MPTACRARSRFRPFFYPPTWLLMLLPFAALAVGKAYALFLSGTAALATVLEGRHDWRAGSPSWSRRRRCGSRSPARTPSSAWRCSTAAFAFSTAVPAAAGILLGLLAYKPQLWLLVPLALVAARQWKALAWMIGTVIVMALASLVVFGPDLWRAFFDAAREAGSARIVDEMLTRVSTQIVSLFAAGYILGLPPGIATALQMAGTLLAVAAVWIAFRRHRRACARTALLATATFLVSPYTLNYDLLLLMPAVVGSVPPRRRGGLLSRRAAGPSPAVADAVGRHDPRPLRPAAGALAAPAVRRHRLAATALRRKANCRPVAAAR